MTQIKSENAKRILQAYYVDGDNNRHLFFLKGLEALEIAESEAEERHAKQLQELRDKAVEAFCSVCKCMNYCVLKPCYNIEVFTQKLTK